MPLRIFKAVPAVGGKENDSQVAKDHTTVQLTPSVVLDAIVGRFSAQLHFFHICNALVVTRDVLQWHMNHAMCCEWRLFLKHPYIRFFYILYFYQSRSL